MIAIDREGPSLPTDELHRRVTAGRPAVFAMYQSLSVRPSATGPRFESRCPSSLVDPSF
jgi:hypothetical protein